MPRQIDLQEIAKKNPNLDLEKLEEWRKLRKSLPGGYEIRKRYAERTPFQGRRAQLVDDAENDPRLIRLQKKH